LGLLQKFCKVKLYNLLRSSSV